MAGNKWNRIRLANQRERGSGRDLKNEKLFLLYFSKNSPSNYHLALADFSDNMLSENKGFRCRVSGKKEVEY